MDILISSNFERLLWFVSQDDKYVAQLMDDLKQNGLFEAKDLLARMDDFVGGFASEEDTANEIKRVFNKENYLIDTHTAVASFVADQIKLPGFMVVLSTASPYKFCSAVLDALGTTPDPDDEFKVLDDLQTASGTVAPKPLASLKTAKAHHKNSGSVDQVKNMIKNFLENK